MGKDTDLSNIENSISSTLKEYENLDMPEDYTKSQAIQLLTKEVKLVSDEKKRAFDEKMQEERYQLEKDDKYWRQSFEEKKFAEESKTNENRVKFEEAKIEIEKMRLELDKSTIALNERNRKEDQKFRWISLAATVMIPMLTTLITLRVYKKLAYANLKLIYIDEGRPTVDFKDSIKSVKNLIK